MFTGIGAFASGLAVGLIVKPEKDVSQLRASASEEQPNPIIIPDKPELPTVNWTMESTFGNGVKGTIIWEVPNRIAQKVDSMTNGKFTINPVYTGKTEDILTNVSDINIETQCGFSGIYYINQDHYPLYFRCAIPFGLSPDEQNAWLEYLQSKNKWLSYYKEGFSPPSTPQSIYQQLGLNIIPFPACATGGQSGGWFKKQITKLSDLKDTGKYIRVPAIGGLVFEKLGLTPHISLSYSAYNGLTINQAVKKLKSENGDFYAVEWIGPHDDEILKLPKAAAICHYPGWWEPSSTFDVQVNTTAWDQLDNHYKDVFKFACKATYAETLAEYNWKNSEALSQLSSDGIDFVRFPEEVLVSAKEITKEVLDQLEQQDTQRPDSKEVFKNVYKDWRDFKDKIRVWSTKIDIRDYQL